MFSFPGEGRPLLSIDRLDAAKAPVLSYLPTLDFYLQHSIFTLQKSERRVGRPGLREKLVALVAAPAGGFTDFNRTAGRVHEE